MQTNATAYAIELIIALVAIIVITDILMFAVVRLITAFNPSIPVERQDDAAEVHVLGGRMATTQPGKRQSHGESSRSETR
jgi:hypothetical protein